ncbi:MAG: hypothetical protein H6719_23420 [Sandaracinaceae bacterium]|nr:hypothetical protein [Sandaracinaceae bacterium]
MRPSLFALCLLACTEAPPPLPRIAPPAPEPPVPAEDEAPAPAAEVDAPEDEEPLFAIYSDLDADEGVLNPDPRVARVLQGILDNLSRASNDAAAGRVGDDYDPDEPSEFDTTASGDCGMPLLHEHLVTITCTDQTTSRMDVSENSAAHHFTILGGEVRPYDPWDAFAPRAEAQARLRAACLSAVEEAEDGERLPFRASCDQLSVRLDEDGLQGFFPVADYSTDENVLFTIELPYADIPELIPEGGLLRALFAGEEPPAPPETEAEEANATAVSHADLDQRLIAQWQTLDDATRRQVGLRRWDGGLAQLAYLGTDVAIAGALATRFGATAARVHVEPALRPLSPTWVRTADDLNLRTAEEGTVLRVLPGGAIVSRADPADAARFVEVLTPFEHGVVARSVLRPHAGCIPRAPEGFEPGLQPLTAIVTLGRRSDGVLFAQSEGGHTRVAVHDLTPSSCAVGDRRFLVEAEGPLRDARLTRTAASGGLPLLVVGTYGEETAVTYVAHVLGTEAPVWRATFDLRDETRTGVRLGERVDGAYFPVTFEEGREPTRLAWTGTELAPPAAE